jgi:hypothetical protein
MCHYSLLAPRITSFNAKCPSSGLKIFIRYKNKQFSHFKMADLSEFLKINF